MEKALYFIALVPPEPYFSEFKALKQNMSDQFESHAALRSPPHITIQMPFQWRPDREHQIHQLLVENKPQPFEIEFNGFNGFEPRVVYIEIKPNTFLISAQKQLEKKLRRVGIHNSTHRNNGFVPHLTIGFRDLKKKYYHEALDYFNSIHCQGKWTVLKYELLKHNGKRWEIISGQDLESGVHL